MKFVLLFVAVALISTISPLVFFNGGFISKARAVEPPTVHERNHASRSYRHKVRHEPTHCAYGADPVTGECYRPKEGQFYRDPRTGKLKKKKVTKYNWPWK